MRVLLVDDEEIVVRATLRLLRRRPGISVIGVLSAADATAQLEHGEFDAVIVDHNLAGGVRGTSLLREIGARSPSTRRVLCTGGALTAREESEAWSCADALLMKPASVEEILEALQPHDKRAVA